MRVLIFASEAKPSKSYAVAKTRFTVESRFSAASVATGAACTVTVRDAGRVILRVGTTSPGPAAYAEAADLAADGTAWLLEHYPDCRDPLAYWQLPDVDFVVDYQRKETLIWAG